MKKKLFANPDLCTGCGRCAYACSAIKEGVYQPSLSRIHVNTISLRGYSVPSICFQCVKASCMEACPDQAISRDANKVLVIDSDACSGCGSCVDACPYGMVEQGEDLIAYKCDYCGGDPACVGECSAGALVFQVQDKSVLKRNALQMKQRSEPGTPREKRHLLSLAVLKVGRGDEQLAVAD